MVIRRKRMHDLVDVAVIGGDSHAYEIRTCTDKYTDADCIWIMVVPTFMKVWPKKQRKKQKIQIPSLFVRCQICCCIHDLYTA